MRTPYLDRRTTAAIKGIALALMFVHHFFTYPEWYVAGISYPALMPLVRFMQTSTRVCVCVFAFLTGYFYHFSRTKTLGYSLRKIRDFLASYWVVYGLLLVPALVLGKWTFSASSFVGGLLGLDGSVMVFCWYVHFYVMAMLVLPVLVKLSTGTLAGDCLVLLALPVLLQTVLLGILREEFGMETGWVVDILAAGREWLPCVVSGYLCAGYGVFEGYFDSYLQKIRTGWGKVLLYLVLCGGAFFGRLLCPRMMLGSVSVAGNWMELVYSMDILYAPLFVYGAANLLQRIRAELVRKPLEAVGRQSMLMWFYHCVFFNCCAAYTQPVLYFLKNPVLVLLFGLGICYLAAVITDIPLKKLLKRKKAAV